MMAPSARDYPQRRLDAVAEFLDGMRRDLPVRRRKPGPYPYFGASGRQGAIDAYLFDEPLVLLAEDLDGYTASGTPFALAVSGRIWVDRRMHVLRPSALVLPEFLARALETLDIERHASGARRNRLTRARAAAIRVPLPPIEEQRRACALLAQADRLRAGRRRTRGQLDAFVRAFFREQFGDPQSNPRRWPRLPLGALGENQDALRSPLGRVASTRAGEGYPRYGAGGIVDWTGEAPYEGERLLLAATGANLVSRLEPVAQVANGRFAVSEHAHVIAANGLAELAYLGYALESIELRPYLGGGTRPRLHRAALERISLPVPPLALQRAFSRLAEKAAAIEALHRACAVRLDELYASLRVRALAPGGLTADR